MLAYFIYGHNVSLKIVRHNKKILNKNLLKTISKIDQARVMLKHNQGCKDGKASLNETRINLLLMKFK